MVGTSPSVMVKVTVDVTTSLSKSLDVTTIDFTMSSLAEWSKSRLGSKRISPSRVINSSPSVKLNGCSPDTLGSRVLTAPSYVNCVMVAPSAL